MKTKLVILLVVGLNTWAVSSFAQNAAAPDAAQTDAAKPVDLAAEKAVDLAEPGGGETGAEIVSLITFDDTPLTDVIKTLARQAGINFQFDPRVTAGVGADGKPTVQPSISIRFEKVTAMQALEAVLVNHNLQMIRDPRTKIGRVTVKDPAAPEPLITRVVQLKFANATNLVPVIKPTLTARSQILADGRTSQLVILTTEKEMESVCNLIEKLDSATKQVLIEARLMETSKNPRSIKGVDWSPTLKEQGVTFGNGITTGKSTTTKPGTPVTSTLPSGRTVTTVPGSSTITTLDTLIGGSGMGLNTAGGFSPATAFLNADGVKVVLSYLNTDADTEVVATPRTVTLDNQTATLSITRANPIFKNTAGTQGSPGGSEVTYTNLGTILTVTPRIAANNMISIKVIPEVSRVVETVRKVVSDTVNEADVYAINRIETQVLVPSGNTLVMGGLISDSINKQFTKVPLLGDIPILGWAFRHEDKRRDKANLLIFVTPTVVQDSDYQPTETDFLKTPLPPAERPDQAWSPIWDSAKPNDWNKKKQGAE